MKAYDAVKMMREIRDKLHREYVKNPEKRRLDLERIRKQYLKKTAES
jgi:hypothetical protein